MVTTVEHMTSAADLQAPITSHLVSGSAHHKLHLWDAANGAELVPTNTWKTGVYAGGTNPVGQTNNAIQVGADKSTSAHIGNGEVGFFLNGFSTTLKPEQNYWSMSFGNAPRNSNIMSWSGTNDFHYAYKQEFKTIYMEDFACGYSYVGMFILDVTTQKVVSVVLADWDSRISASGGDYAAIAPVQNPDGSLSQVIPFIGGTLGNSSFVESYGDHYNKGNVAGMIFQRYGTITRANMQNMIAAFKGLSANAPHYDTLAAEELSNNGATPTYLKYLDIAKELRGFTKMSNNTSDYQVIGIGLQPELANTKNGLDRVKGQVGLTYKDVVFSTWTN